MSTDPFAEPRRSTGYAEGRFGDEMIPLILRYRDVRLAANDTARFSSDAPGRLPIPDETDVRDLRQLPIETDPPIHTDYRDIVRPWFRRPADPAYARRIEAIVDSLLDAAQDRPEVEAVSDLALPLQSRALAVLLGLPEAEADIWIGWGIHAFKVEGRNVPEKARTLETYIHDRIRFARATPGEDFFSMLLAAEFRGRKLITEEIVGFAHVTFAGGRDTVINTLVFALDHLSHHPDALDRLRSDPALVVTATEEYVRHLSPLSHFARICPAGDKVGGLDVPPGGRVGLCWASANHDETVFESPQDLRLDRSPNPHVGFGSGPHNCLGSTHARLVIRTFLARLARRNIRIQVKERVPLRRNIGGFSRSAGFGRLVLSAR
jgi:Cytochrome P450